MDIFAQFQMGGREYEIHSQVINGWMVSIVIWIILILAGKKISQSDPKAAPSGLALAAEMLVEMVESFVESTMGAHNRGFAPFIGSLILFLSISNLLTLLGLEPPTSDVNVTLALALFTIGMMVYTGIRHKGVLKTLRNMFMGEFPALLPLEVLIQLVRPVSLAFRLFGVILSGALLLNLAYQALGWFSPLVAPFLHLYFDVFDGLVQVLIFVILAMVWTSMLTEQHDHRSGNHEIQEET